VKKILFLFFLFSFSFQFSYSQVPDWVWARSGINPSQNGTAGYSIATDNANNLFITGYYSDSITFGSYVLTGTLSVFLAEYDLNGNVKWAKTASGGYSWGNGIATDIFGNSYITGYFSTIVSFGSHTLVSAGGVDIFLVKYDPLGNVLWAKSAGGAGADGGYGVAVDAFGNVCITGYFSSSPFMIGAFTFTNAGGDDIFIAKYDSAGNVLWAKSAGGTSYDDAYSISSDSSGNVFITGIFDSPLLTFGSYTLNNAGGHDIFLAKYDSSGNVLWAKSAGGTSDDFGYHIATDASGNVYLTGYYNSSSITFGSFTFTNAGIGDNAFLIKYNSSGNVIWAKNIGVTGYELGWCVKT